MPSHPHPTEHWLPRAWPAWTAVVMLLLLPAATLARDIVGSAIVRDDATLLIAGRKVHLAGIFIPPTERSCRTFLRPAKCASRAALALDFKIHGFVHCETRTQNQDRSIVATCWVDRTYHSSGEDLSAYLLQHGWAVPLPDAPFEYQVLGDIAREKQRGVWGFQVDAVR